ncbi:putative cytosol aminopeptidase [Bacteroidia bacterium]|nr:putative cytosol aminopeptidase [Bacteroidia bacterium]
MLTKIISKKENIFTIILKNESDSDVCFLFNKNEIIVESDVFFKNNDLQILEKNRLKGSETLNFLRKNVKNLKNVQIVSENVSKENLIAFLEGFLLSNYSFDRYKSEKKDKIEEILLISDNISSENIDFLNVTEEMTTFCRDLVNEPHIHQSATQFAETLSQKAKDLGVNCRILNKKEIEAEKMGGLLGVNRGSIEAPTFTVLEINYDKNSNEQPIILVGKGLVFDTGGLNIKTGSYMDTMKEDMSGGALVASTAFALAKLGYTKPLVVLIPATDNRPGENALAPGDVITMRSGTTVEVSNTDAEGRLILADALDYAKQYHPKLVVDAATLTGSASRAVGKQAAVAMQSRAENELETLKKAGFKTYERIVELPLWDEYADDIKSDIADLDNSGGTYAGAITAGKFLQHFTDYPFIHLDIAGVSFFTKAFKYYGKGGSAFGLRLLVEFLFPHFSVE